MPLAFIGRLSLRHKSFPIPFLKANMVFFYLCQVVLPVSCCYSSITKRSVRIQDTIPMFYSLNQIFEQFQVMLSTLYPSNNRTRIMNFSHP